MSETATVPQQAKEEAPVATNDSVLDRTVFVSNVAAETQGSELIKFFSIFGVVESFSPESTDASQQTKTFKVTFEKPESVVTALALDGKPFGMKTLHIVKAADFEKKKEPQALLSLPIVEEVGKKAEVVNQSYLCYNNGGKQKREEVERTVYVGNLPPMTTQEEVRQLFAGYGFVDYLKVSSSSAEPNST